MPSKSGAAENMEVKEQDRNSPYAIIFELEGVAIEARKAEFDVLQSLLREHGVEITPIHFSRNCLNTTPSNYLPDLLEALGVKKISAVKLAEEVEGGVALYLSSGDAVFNPSVKKILEAGANRGMAMAMMTTVKGPTLDSLSERFGFDEWGVQSFEFERTDRTFPRADCWLRIAKSLSKTPRQCLVITGSRVSAKAALSAGMRCVVVPDEFTVFQDFSGADVILDLESEFDPDELLNMLCPQNKPF